MAEAATTSRRLPYVAAITDGVRAVLKEFDNSFVIGEDVAGAGSVYGYYNGLLAEFGAERIYDSPISEEGIVGLGVGAAATGCRPIVDLMFMDFMGECMDEIANQLAKMRYMFGGAAKLPLTMLTMAGAGASLAAQHSQSLEAWVCHVPDNPVIVVLNKMSLAMQGEVPTEAYEIPLGKAHIVRPGGNYTIIALGRMVHEAMKAAEQLKAFGLDVEVIDPRTLQPFDSATVIDSVKRTHRALIVHEAVRFGGLGGEIAAQLQELAFDYLDAPIARVGAPFSPVPYSPALEAQYVPNADRIVAAVKQQLGL
jgi:pyruvate dehydrogenase E1 component beta subunit